MASLSHKEIQKIFANSNSNDVISTVDLLMQKPDNNTFILLFDLYINTENKEIIDKLLSVFILITDNDAVDYIVNIIGKGISDDKLLKLLGVIWQTKLNFAKHINVFVNLMDKNNYFLLVENYTIIEEIILENEVDSEIINSNISILEKFCEDKSKSTDVKNLIKELIKSLNNVL